MLRQNPDNPCELQQWNETTSQWNTIFTITDCCFTPKQQLSSIGKHCNIASLLTEITLPDGVEKLLQIQESGASSSDLIGAVAGIFAGIPGLDVGLVVFLLSVSAASVIANLITPYTVSDVQEIRNAMDNQYWLDLKRELYCALPSEVSLSPEVLRGLA